MIDVFQALLSLQLLATPRAGVQSVQLADEAPAHQVREYTPLKILLTLAL